MLFVGFALVFSPKSHLVPFWELFFWRNRSIHMIAIAIQFGFVLLLYWYNRMIAIAIKFRWFCIGAIERC